MFNLLGILLPFVIDVLGQNITDSKLRLGLSFFVCAVVGVGVNWVTTQFVFATPMEAAESISASILAMFGVAQLSYKFAWENSDTRENLGLLPLK